MQELLIISSFWRGIARLWAQHDSVRKVALFFAVGNIPTRRGRNAVLSVRFARALQPKPLAQPTVKKRREDDLLLRIGDRALLVGGNGTV